eukprot:CAMPEP_0177659408 /NCGR_PEP_ID=MMETSP0447-20121125/17426_1 /TAXON_ID=0 /ORGANISM="Stygamoeba regulata, Strain BSH-02190019" /LENGTH=1211 /DNA_ID=CAMNT_0019164275 /DNA_START=102 /DNA_END=3733 /DNA_ORIENTATION=+
MASPSLFAPDCEPAAPSDASSPPVVFGSAMYGGRRRHMTFRRSQQNQYLVFQQQQQQPGSPSAPCYMPSHMGSSPQAHTSPQAHYSPQAYQTPSLYGQPATTHYQPYSQPQYAYAAVPIPGSYYAAPYSGAQPSSQFSSSATAASAPSSVSMPSMTGFAGGVSAAHIPMGSPLTAPSSPPVSPQLRTAAYSPGHLAPHPLHAAREKQRQQQQHQQQEQKQKQQQQQQQQQEPPARKQRPRSPSKPGTRPRASSSTPVYAQPPPQRLPPRQSQPSPQNANPLADIFARTPAPPGAASMAHSPPSDHSSMAFLQQRTPQQFSASGPNGMQQQPGGAPHSYYQQPPQSAAVPASQHAGPHQQVASPLPYLHPQVVPATSAAAPPASAVHANAARFLPHSSQNPRHRSLPMPLATPPTVPARPAARSPHGNRAKADQLRMLQRMSHDSLPGGSSANHREQSPPESAATPSPNSALPHAHQEGPQPSARALSPLEVAAEQERLRMYALAQCKQTNTLFVDDIGFEECGESEVEHMPDEKLLALLKLPTRALRFCKKGKPRAVTLAVSGDGRELVCTPLEGDRKSSIRVMLRDVEELRKGQKTMIFEKQRQGDLAQRSFSLVYGFKRTLNLVMSTEREFDVITVGLVRLISILKDEDSATALVAKEWNRFGRDVLSRGKIETLLRRLNFKISSRELKRRVKELDSSGSLVFDQFLHLLSLLRERTTVVELFERYSSNKEYLTDGEFLHFLHAEQHDSHLHAELARELMARFQAPGELGMTREAFSAFLSSNANSPMDPCRAVVSHDMHQPLSHYYVNTSHNTYLEGHQLRGRSSTDMYIRALRNGCRCVELDCHDGDDGQPIIYHGHTLTSRIRFRDVIEAVHDYGFETSPFPLVLSLEIHNGKRQQRAMAAILREVLEAMLPPHALHLEQPDAEQLPSPHELRGMVLLKGSGKLVPELAQLIYLKGGSFTAEPDMLESRPAYNMCSLDESKLLALRPADVSRYTASHLARTYPKGTRFDSSNYDPFPAWNTGCQLVALNLQTSDAPVWFNEGRFRDNGNCGYLLKPAALRQAATQPFDYTQCTADQDPPLPVDCPMRVLRVRVISGRQLPKPSTDKEIVDPFVRLEVRGVPADDQRAKTKKISQNGFSPHWDETFAFELVLPDAAQLLFVLYDKDLTKTTKLGYSAYPISALRPGYRMLTFNAVDGSGQIPFCDLL